MMARIPRTNTATATLSMSDDGHEPSLEEWAADAAAMRSDAQRPHPARPGSASGPMSTSFSPSATQRAGVPPVCAQAENASRRRSSPFLKTPTATSVPTSSKPPRSDRNRAPGKVFFSIEPIASSNDAARNTRLVGLRAGRVSYPTFFAVAFSFVALLRTCVTRLCILLS
jgi:hypothetical protein